MNGSGYERRAHAVLIFQREGWPLCMGDLNPDKSGRLTNLRLELISDLSFCGFRLDMTCNAGADIWNWPCEGSTGLHSVLFRVRWACRDFSLRQCSDEEKAIMHRTTSLDLPARDFVSQPLQCISFSQAGGEYPFIFKEMGTLCLEHTVCPFQFILDHIIDGENFKFCLRKEDLNNLEFERWRKDSHIASWADNPYQECDDLPETTVRQWSSNVQTCMTAGLADLANDVFYRGMLKDGLRATLTTHSLARSLKQFLNIRYKDIKAEPQEKIYPVFVNFRGGKFNDRTFTNDDNAAVCVVLIADLLSASFLTGADVGIVAVYGGQVKTYERALTMLNAQNPGRGYADVRVGTVEWWSTRTAEVVIFDMVGLGIDRTSKSQYLAQRVRLQIALTTHRQGLVIIGSIRYWYDYVRSPRKISDPIRWDATLEQVLSWLINASRLTTINLTPYSIIPTIRTSLPSTFSEETERTTQEQAMSLSPPERRAGIYSSGMQYHDSSNGSNEDMEMAPNRSKKRARSDSSSTQLGDPENSMAQEQEMSSNPSKKRVSQYSFK